MSLKQVSLGVAGPALAISGFGAPLLQHAQAQIQFDVPVDYPMPSEASGLAVADMNADSRPDVIVAETFETVALYENQGEGVFQRVWAFFEANTTLSHLRVADIDGNGLPDVLWVAATPDPSNPHRYQYDLKVLYGQERSAPRFQSISLGGRTPAGVALGDLDDDGAAEVVVVEGYHFEDPSRVLVFVSRDGLLEPGQIVPLQNNESRDVVAGDLDGDGDIDIAVMNADTYINYYQSLKVYSSQIDLLMNDGTGQLELGAVAILPFGGGLETHVPIELRIGDLDGDGDLDFAVSASYYGNNRPAHVVVVESLPSGQGHRTHPPLEAGTRSWSPTHLAIADFNVDGDLDLAIRSQTAGFWAFANEGGLQFTGSWLGSGDGLPAPMVAADVNNDGKHDLVAGWRNGWQIHSNATPYAGPVLEHTVLKRGRPLTMTVSDAQPGETVHFLYSREGAGNSVGIRQLGGITLDLLDPIQIIGSAVADGNGVAELTITVPPNAPLSTVVMQAVIRRGPGGADSIKTPFRTARILP